MNRRRRSTFRARRQGLQLCPYRFASMFPAARWFAIGEDFGA